jgi:signal transduction histidine kinase
MIVMTTPTTTRRRSTVTERPWRVRLGFRGRVLGFSALLLLTATVAGVAIQRAVLLQRLDRQVAADLEQERRELEVLAAGRDPDTGQPFAGDVRAIFDSFLQRNVPNEGEVYLTFIDGQPYATTRAPGGVRLDHDPELAARWASLTVGDRGRLETAAGLVEYLAVPLLSQGRTAGVFVVANFTAGERSQIDAALRVEAAVSALVLVAAVAVSWVIAGRLLRPVRELTDTARSISETDLSQRIPVEGDDEIAELARTFNQMLDRLAAAFAAQQAFVADAGHELRTPITIVRGHLDVMGDDPQARQETLALVTDELDRMGRIVEDLLLLAKAEQPGFVQLEPVELTDLTTELLMKARALGDRAWRLDRCAEGIVLGDPQRLAQAVLNLARNAVEQTRPGAEIALGSARRGSEIHLWVRDTGPGVDPAERDRIFERFARGGHGPRRSDGAGLGLAIVKAVAAGHHGRVELDSRPGAGATFTVVIPDRRVASGAGAGGKPSEEINLPAFADQRRVDITQEIEPYLDPDPTREMPVPGRTHRWPGS